MPCSTGLGDPVGAGRRRHRLRAPASRRDVCRSRRARDRDRAERGDARQRARTGERGVSRRHRRGDGPGAGQRRYRRRVPSLSLVRDARPRYASFGASRRLRAALLQYERDERNAFTKAYGDCVRAHANDDTEQMRMRALAVFSNFPEARVMRYAYPASRNSISTACWAAPHRRRISQTPDRNPSRCAATCARSSTKTNSPDASNSRWSAS